MLTVSLHPFNHFPLLICPDPTPTDLSLHLDRIEYKEDQNILLHTLCERQLIDVSNIPDYNPLPHLPHSNSPAAGVSSSPGLGVSVLALSHSHSNTSSCSSRSLQKWGKSDVTSLCMWNLLFEPAWTTHKSWYMWHCTQHETCFGHPPKGLKCACFNAQLYILLRTVLATHTSCLHMVLNVNAHPLTSSKLLSIYLLLRAICPTHPISISIHMDFVRPPMPHLSCSLTPCPALPLMTSHLMRMTCMALIPTLKPSAWGLHFMPHQQAWTHLCSMCFHFQTCLASNMSYRMQMSLPNLIEWIWHWIVQLYAEYTNYYWGTLWCILLKWQWWQCN